MRKFLSILLAAAMLVAVFSVSVLAAPKIEHPNKVTTTPWDPTAIDVPANVKYSLIGSQEDVDPGDPGDPENGKPTFDPTAVKSNIKVNFGVNGGSGDGVGQGGAIEERYAVDIEYWALIVDLTKLETGIPDGLGGEVEYKYVWNVDTHKYVLLKQDNTVAPNDAVETLALVPLYTDAFQITNHSSKEIYYTAKVTSQLNETNVPMLMSLTKGADGKTDWATPESSVETVDRTVAGAATNEVAKGDKHCIKSLPDTDKTWVDVINGMEKHVVNDANIGALTIKVAMFAEDAKIDNGNP